MNAAVRIEQAEYFHCGARATIFSQAHCAKSWLQRNQEDGSAACRACPAIVRETVARGGADMITGEEVLMGFRLRPVGQTLETVPGRLRGEARDPAEKRVMRSWAARKGKITILLRKSPWLVVGEVGKHLEMHRDNARGVLAEMVKAGTVQRYRKNRTERWRYALAGEQRERLSDG